MLGTISSIILVFFMNSLEIEKQIMTHLSEWDLFDKAKTARLNRNFTPPKTGVWIRVSVVGGINHIACMNDKPCVREVGTLIIQLFDRENTGTAELKRHADSLARHLSCYKAERLELLAPSIINAGVSDGFYQINVSVPYRYC